MVDQIISGTVINLLAVGMTGYIRAAFLLKGTQSAPGVFPYVFRNTPLWDLPILGPILFQYQPMVYAAMILVPTIWFVLFRTPWGLRTRSVGEHPRAADTLGINVFRTRYINVILAGSGWCLVLAGDGGPLRRPDDQRARLYRAGGHDRRQLEPHRRCGGCLAFRVFRRAEL
jgi:ABC-type uncharacterized transport system permease subunit